MPRTIEVELSRDLTDTASPGDVVTITGLSRFFIHSFNVVTSEKT